jgi:hypothetical protein
MGDRIPIFDVFGNWLGDFLPAGAGCGCGPMAAAIFVFLMYCAPVINLIGPPVLFLLAFSLPKNYKHRDLFRIFTTALLAVWLVGMVALVGMMLGQ